MLALHDRPRRRRLLVLLVGAALAAAVLGATARPTPAGASEPVRAAQHMVAAANPHAARAGRAVLRAGGSAIDAAIAMQLVLNVVEPQSSGIGGGAFLLYYDKARGQVYAYDGRETAPAAATADLFIEPGGQRMKFYDAVVGGRAVGVPGLLAMLELAHVAHGKLPWSDLFDPAIRLATEGFALSPRLHKLVARDRHLTTFITPRVYFYTWLGRPKPVGAVLKNQRLARTFRIIAKGGGSAFYRGPIARDVVTTVRRARRNPGRLSTADFTAYRARARTPVCLPYRSWRVCGMPPPSSGGITTLQILGMLSHFDLGGVAPGSAEAVHLLSEASRLAFADRARFIADGDFVRVPVEGLLDHAYLAARARLIDPARSMGHAKAGEPPARASRRRPSDDSSEHRSTTHLSVVDRAGNAASMTSSIESAFGSRLMVRGFLLNNQLTDFSFVAEKDGVAIANRVEPGKRPRSSMAPTLVFDDHGRLVMALGSPGGSRIIGYVVKTIVAVLDWGLDVQAAINLAHHVNRNGATELEGGTAISRLAGALESRGHKVVERELVSGLHAIAVVPGGLEGGADRRREGIALGD